MSNQSIGAKSFEEHVDELKKKTGILDEVTIGCYLSNYGDRYICGRFKNESCRGLEKCTRLDKAAKQ